MKKQEVIVCFEIGTHSSGASYTVIGGTNEKNRPVSHAVLVENMSGTHRGNGSKVVTAILLKPGGGFHSFGDKV